MPNITIDKELCVTCGECGADCSVQVIRAPKGEYPEVVAEREQFCSGCRHCLTVCPTGALSFEGSTAEDCIPLKGALPSPEQMEALIRGRRTTRRYVNESLDATVIDRLLTITANAPTGKNKEPVHFTLIDSLDVMDAFRKDMYAAMGAFVDKGELPKGLEFIPGLVKMYEDKGIDPVFRGAPHLVVASLSPASVTPEADGIIALSYFELMAASMGLGTVWCGLFMWILNGACPELKDRLGIPEDHTVSYAMAFGTPAVKHHRCTNRDNVQVSRVKA